MYLARTLSDGLPYSGYASYLLRSLGSALSFLVAAFRSKCSMLGGDMSLYFVRLQDAKESEGSVLHDPSCNHLPVRNLGPEPAPPGYASYLLRSLGSALSFLVAAFRSKCSTGCWEVTCPYTLLGCWMQKRVKAVSCIYIWNIFTYSYRYIFAYYHVYIYLRAPQLPLRQAGFACRKIRLGIATFPRLVRAFRVSIPTLTPFLRWYLDLVPLCWSLFCRLVCLLLFFSTQKVTETGRSASFCQWWGQDMNLSLTYFYYLHIYIYIYKSYRMRPMRRKMVTPTNHPDIPKILNGWNGCYGDL